MSKVSSIGDELAALASYISHLMSDPDAPPALGNVLSRLQAAQEHVAAEEASLWRPNQFDSLVAGLHVGVLVYGPQGQLWMSNQAASELLALNRMELLAQETWDMIHEDGSPFPDEQHPVVQARISGKPVRNVVMGVYRQRHQDRIWLLVSAEPKLNPDGTVKRVLCTFSDISDLKQAEQAVRLSEERFRRLFLSAPTGIALVSLQSEKIVQANPAFCHLVGYGEDELQGMTVADLTYPDDWRVEAPLLVQAIADLGSYHLEKRYVTKAGDLRWVYLSATILPDGLGKPEYALGIVEDITERKDAEAALRSSEQRLRTLFDAAQRQALELTLLDRVRSAIARELDPQTIFRKVVTAVAETFGYTQVSIYLVQDGVSRLQYQVGYDQMIPEISINKGVSGRVIRSGRPMLVKDVRSDPDFLGAIEGIVSEVCVPLFDYEQVVGILNVESTEGVELDEDDLRVLVAVGEEISVALGRAKLYAQVRESEARNRAMLDAMPDMLVRHDREANYLDLKPAANFAPLLPVEEMLGKNVRDVLPAVFVESVLPRIARVLASGEMEIYEYSLFQDGREKHFESRMVKSGEDEVIAITRDITDAKQAIQNQFDRERIRLLTTFISDTSHDLRTPITNLISSSYLLGKLTEKLLAEKIRLTDLLDSAVTPEVQASLLALDETVVKIDQRADVLEQNSLRLRKLVESMIDMVRLESDLHFEFKPRDLNHLVKEGVQKLLPQAQAKDIALHIEPCGEALLANVDEDEFSRVIDGLLTNAIDYTPARGSVKLRVYTEAGRVVWEVKDTGIGISPEDLPRIFEPFFRVSKARPTDTGGAGLGLTIAKKIVEAHGGHIEVESRLNQGSTFRVVLPASG